MVTITLPVYTDRGVRPTPFDIRELSFAAPILDQGKGARKTWRERVHDLKFTAYESDEVKRWNEDRAAWRDVFGVGTPPMHGIRARERRRLELREAAFALAREQMRGIIVPDEHDPRL